MNAVNQWEIKGGICTRALKYLLLLVIWTNSNTEMEKIGKCEFEGNKMVRIY